mmetsp:Transcript_17090/g.33460  ORF Transcript_17090/g.33460 Transcript_17090/m.33460 type:complete len:82 (+) Transcript_17090:489-734(+)
MLTGLARNSKRRFGDLGRIDAFCTQENLAAFLHRARYLEPKQAQVPENLRRGGEKRNAGANESSVLNQSTNQYQSNGSMIE